MNRLTNEDLVAISASLGTLHKAEDEAAMKVLIEDLEPHRGKKGVDVMIEKAKRLAYSDYNDNDGIEGKTLLMEDATAAGLTEICKQMIDGKYDS